MNFAKNIYGVCDAGSHAGLAEFVLWWITKYDTNRFKLSGGTLKASCY